MLESNLVVVSVIDLGSAKKCCLAIMYKRVMTGEKLSFFFIFFISYHGSGVFPLGEFVKYP